MKNLVLRCSIFIIAVFTFLFLLPKTAAYASCPELTVKVDGKTVANRYQIPSGSAVTFSVNISTLTNSQTVNGAWWMNAGKTSGFGQSANAVGNTVTFTVNKENGVLDASKENVPMQIKYVTNGKTMLMCEDSFAVSSTISGNCAITVEPTTPSVSSTITARVTKTSGDKLTLKYKGPNASGGVLTTIAASDLVYAYPVTVPNNGIGTYSVWLSPGDQCLKQFQVTTSGTEELLNGNDLCSYVATDKMGACTACINTPGMWTAIGCIPATLDGLLQRILPFSIGIAGGIAFLLILFGALQMMTSAGNPEKLNAGKELVGAAITGLLFIIFAVFLLRLIGFQILKIPGFGG